MLNQSRADRCRIAREKRGWTQLQAAKATGWHVNTIRKYERRETRHLQPYIELASAYGCSLGWLAAGTELPPTKYEERIQSLTTTVHYLKQTLATAHDAIERAEGWLEEVGGLKIPTDT